MNLSNEQLQEKKLYLENELKKLQHDLVEILNHNDLLTLQNKEKDEVILQKDKKLNEIKDKNVQDLEQLRTERICMIDRYDHEIELIEDSIKRVELSRDRYEQLEKENEIIQQSLAQLRETMSIESRRHAKEVHEINASTRVMREQMEAAFRKELIEMDLIFQRQAFSSMDDTKKKALLANSKLKDELALQSVGISNLTVRCQRDKQSQKVLLGEMKLLSQKIEGLRQKLSSLQLKKANTALDINALENEVTLSLEKEKITLGDLKRWPEQEQLIEGIEEISDCYKETKHELKLWHQRYKKLAQLYSDMKSIKTSNSVLKKSMSSSLYSRQNTLNQDEFSSSTQLSPMPSPYPSSPARSPTKPNLQSSQSFSENLSLQLSQHPDLKVAFKPLIGRESTLLPPTSTVAECVRQVLAILQKGNFKKKYIYEGKQSSDDDSSSLVSFVAFPDDPHPQPKELLDGPFSNQTRQLLYRVPSLKKSIYWNKEYLENFIQVKRNSIPFGNDSDDDENVVDPPSSPPPQVSFSKEETSNPADDIVQTSWLKKYEKILSDDLLEEPQQSKIKSPTTRLPMIFPPLSSTKSIALIESFPIKESQSSHDLMESSLSKKKSVDPLSNKKKIVSSSSQSLLLSKKKFPKMTSSLSKL